MKKLAEPEAPDSGDTADAMVDAGIEAAAPIAATNTDAAAMPASGGSFIRQPDGSLVRANDEEGPPKWPSIGRAKPSSPRSSHLWRRSHAHGRGQRDSG
jgi:hypothetical protein